MLRDFILAIITLQLGLLVWTIGEDLNGIRDAIKDKKICEISQEGE